MGLTYNTRDTQRGNNMASQAKMAERHIYRTTDDRLVFGNHPEAAFLAYAPGDEVELQRVDEYDRLMNPPTASLEDEGAANLEDEGAKAADKTADKAAAKPADKAAGRASK